MFVWAEKLSYMEQSQNKSIKAVAEKLQRKTTNYWYYHWYPFIWEFCSAKAIVWPCYITQIKWIYKERKKKSQLKLRQKDGRKLRQVIFSGDLLRQISSEKNMNLPSFTLASPILTWLYCPHANFKFERVQIETLLRDFSTIKRFRPYQKGFLFLVHSFENIYNRIPQSLMVKSEYSVVPETWVQDLFLPHQSSVTLAG